MLGANHPVRLTIIMALVIATSLFMLQTNTASALTLTDEEQTMIGLINQERQQEGLKPLKVDARLTKIAREHSQEMIDRNFFSHYSPSIGPFFNRLKNAGIKNWWSAGENLAGATTVEIAFSALMQSPEHKENLLNPRYTRMGIGIRDGGLYGKMFTQDFVEETPSLPVETKNAGLSLILLAPAATLFKKILHAVHLV